MDIDRARAKGHGAWQGPGVEAARDAVFKSVGVKVALGLGDLIDGRLGGSGGKSCGCGGDENGGGGKQAGEGTHGQTPVMNWHNLRAPGDARKLQMI